jgi:hypothetical protein
MDKVIQKETQGKMVYSLQIMAGWCYHHKAVASNYA